MKKQSLAGLATGLLVFGVAVAANATLITIGTATYNGSDYNLIWDDDNNGNSVVWLDYTNGYTDPYYSTSTFWSAQKSWAATLDSALSYNIDAAYSVTWDDAAWRLGSTVDGAYLWGYDGTTTAGYNITSSEMGHLFYEELGNLGYYDTSKTYQPGYGLVNTGDFVNLVADWYWSGTDYVYSSTGVWAFNMGYGTQQPVGMHGVGYGLAVRSGQVCTAPVPEPATMLLFGTGLAGLAGVCRRKKS